MTIRALPAPRATRSGGSLVERLAGAIAVWRQRRRLADLDAHLLKDIGLSREAAEREARRGLWDAPEHWLR